MKANLSKLLTVILSCLTMNMLQAQTKLTDSDGNSYSTIIISGTEWMTENLDVSHYANGDIIPRVQDPAKWAAARNGAWCLYDFREGNHVIKGKLYNGYAILDKRGLAPAGWKIPVTDDWYKMEEWKSDSSKGYLTSDTSKLRLFLRNDISTMKCWENRSYYRTGKGEFGKMKCLGLWWLPENDDMTWQLSRCENRDGYWFGMAGLPADWKNYGFFVRCVKVRK